MIFREIELWIDPRGRSGPEAMAVDEWLLETRDLPMLRVYEWSGEWGSLGYFGKLEEAQISFPGLNWVRRLTGGGVVDHRQDWTYSLMVPKKYDVACWKGGESYRAIHAELAEVLAAEGDAAASLAGMHSKAGGVCFENPVEFDVVSVIGKKIAGAAQRRCRAGLLHQGSVSVRKDFRKRAESLAEKLAESWQEVEVLPDIERIKELVDLKYGSEKWLRRA